MQLSFVLEKKEKEGFPLLVTIGPDSSVVDAITKDCRYHVDALAVVDQNPEELRGIVTKRDLLESCCHDLQGIETKPVKTIMTKQVVTAEREMKVVDALDIMARKKVRQLPVLDKNKRILGLLTLDDLIFAHHEEDEMKIRALSDYLAGTHGVWVY